MGHTVSLMCIVALKNRQDKKTAIWTSYVMLMTNQNILGIVKVGGENTAFSYSINNQIKIFMVFTVKQCMSMGDLSVQNGISNHA